MLRIRQQEQDTTKGSRNMKGEAFAVMKGVPLEKRAGFYVELNEMVVIPCKDLQGTWDIKVSRYSPKTRFTNRATDAAKMRRWSLTQCHLYESKVSTASLMVSASAMNCCLRTATPM